MAIDRSRLHRMCRGPVPNGVVIQAAASLSPPRRRRPDPTAPQRNPPAPPRPVVHRRVIEQDYERVVKHYSGLPHDVPEAFRKTRGASSMMVELMELDHSIFSLLILEAQSVAAAEPPALHLYRQMQLAKATAAGLKKEKLKIQDPNGGMSRLAATITRMKKHKDPEDLQALKALLAEVNVAALLYEPLVAKLREQEVAMGNIVANAVAHMRRNRGQVPPASSQARPVVPRAQPSALAARPPVVQPPQVQPQSSAATAQRVVPPDQRAAAVGGVSDNGQVPPAASQGRQGVPRAQPTALGARLPSAQAPQVQPQSSAATAQRVVPPDQSSAAVGGVWDNGQGQVPPAASQGRQGVPRAQPTALGARLPSVQAPQFQPQSSAATAQRVVPPDQRAAAVGGVLDNAASPTAVQPPQVQPQLPAASSHRVVPASAAPGSSQARTPARDRSSQNLQAPKRRRSVSPASASASLAPTTSAPTSSTSSAIQGRNGAPIATPSVPNQPSNNPELRRMQVARRTVVPAGPNTPPAQNPVHVAHDGASTPPISAQPSHAPPLPKKAKVDQSQRAGPVSPTVSRSRTDFSKPASIPPTGTSSPPASAQPSNAPPLQKKVKVDMSARVAPVSPTTPRSRPVQLTRPGAQDDRRATTNAQQNDASRMSPDPSPMLTTAPALPRRQVVPLTIARDMPGPANTSGQNRAPPPDATHHDNAGPLSPDPSPGPSRAPPLPRRPMVSHTIARDISDRATTAVNRDRLTPTPHRAGHQSPEPSPGPSTAPVLPRRPMVSLTVARDLAGSSSGGVRGTPQDRSRVSPEPSPRPTVAPGLPPRPMHSIVPGLHSPPPSVPRSTPPPLPRRK